MNHPLNNKTKQILGPQTSDVVGFYADLLVDATQNATWLAKNAKKEIANGGDAESILPETLFAALSVALEKSRDATTALEQTVNDFYETEENGLSVTDIAERREKFRVCVHAFMAADITIHAINDICKPKF